MFMKLSIILLSTVHNMLPMLTEFSQLATYYACNAHDTDITSPYTELAILSYVQLVMYITGL